MSKPLVILGTEFQPIKASPQVQDTISHLLDTEPGTYWPRYDVFACPFYPNAVIAIVYERGISPLGLGSIMFVKDSLIKRFFPTLVELPEYNAELGLDLNRSSVLSFASCVACYATPRLEEEDRFLREPASFEALLQAGVPAHGLVEVEEVPDGWAARSYRVLDDTSNLVFVDFCVPRDGCITRADFKFEIRPETIRKKALMR